ncbi:MAG TPA: hypothetical protein DCE25_10490 [Pseudomonas sp.]|nr:hypothetical protein [Pseudomonas sp.]
MLNQSFTAQLKVMGIEQLPDGWVQASNSELMLIIDAPNVDLADTGWLVLAYEDIEYEAEVATLRFDLLDAGSRRFKVSCVSPHDFAGRLLDTSRNGYVGAYTADGKAVYWTLEPTQWGAGHTVVKLRDSNGVAVTADDRAYVVTRGSTREELCFDLLNYQPI